MLFGKAAIDSIAAELRVSAYPILASALLVAGCSSDLGGSPSASKDENEAVSLDALTRGNAPLCDPRPSRLCLGPAPGSVKHGPIVVGTAEYVWLCQAGGCAGHSSFFDISQVALAYGDFPFDEPNNPFRVGEWFFAVVAPGYEDGGFRDGAPGNLSDRTASCAPGDLGKGDSVGDRTIINVAPDPDEIYTPFFPTSHGTHDTSVLDSGWMLLALAPFDTTPDGKYVLAVCPKGASSRCDCVFERFSVEPAKAGGSNL